MSPKGISVAILSILYKLTIFLISPLIPPTAVLPADDATLSYDDDDNFLEVDETTPALAVIRQLLQFVEEESSNTFQEFHQKMKQKIIDLKEEDLKTSTSVAQVSCVSEIFLRYISLKSALFNNFNDAKEDLKNRGRIFLENVSKAKEKVARTGQAFISDGSTILVHAASRVVFLTLREAFRENKRFMVYVTLASPSNEGADMVRWLNREGISCKLIPDSSMGYIMESVDMVLVGAEAVVKNGGIFNKTGSYPIAVCAHTAHKPVYVVVESYKFSQFFPLRQKDIPVLLKKTVAGATEEPLMNGSDSITDIVDPGVDYTPPRFVTLLITDLGPLATAAVSDVLMQLYV